MQSRTWAAVVLAAAAVISIPSAAAAAADEATLLRVFLTDGTSLVSYGEPAKVNDRVALSVPTATTPNPPLHLVNLPASRAPRVFSRWEPGRWPAPRGGGPRETGYAATARASHYDPRRNESA